MKFTLNKDLLSNSSSIVQRAASSKDVVPALSGMLITARDQSVTFQATDLDIGIKKTISPVNIEREGQVLVNAKYFNDVIRFLSDEEVTIEFDEELGKLKVLYGLSSTFLNLYNQEDFPEMPLDSTNIKVLGSIPQAVLRNFIKKTAFAAASAHFKPVFTGILFDFNLENFTMVASDTHRLAIISGNQIEGIEGKYIVPVRTLVEIARVIEEKENKINFGLVDNHIVFFVEEDNFYCSTRLIEGSYPNYNQVVPAECANMFYIDADRLTKALERVALMPTDPKSIQSVKIRFFPTEIILSAFSDKMGEITERITEVEADNEKPFEVSFNTRYLLDGVKILNAETKTIQIGISGPLSPAIVKSPADENYKYILVPLRTV